MRLIFISDLHLSPQTPLANQVFFNLLASWQNNCAGLYILGDFFDYWLGDDDDNPFIRDIRHHLSLFSQQVPVYFRGGNHDFAVGKKFARLCGMQLIPDMHTLQAAGHTLLLSHGDTFCSLDLNYQRLKKILQNRLTIYLLTKLPLKWRYKIKQQLEQRTQVHNNQQQAHIYQVVDSTIAAYARRYQATLVIHGHTHHPGHYLVALDSATNDQPKSCQSTTQLSRYELPDWADRSPGGYLVIEDDKITVILSA